MAHHASAAGNAQGQCATVNIALTPGMKHHPGVKCRLEQVRSWFDLIESEQVDLVDLTRMIYHIKRHIINQEEGARWRRV